jgi:hypothetical protein
VLETEGRLQLPSLLKEEANESGTRPLWIVDRGALAVFKSNENAGAAGQSAVRWVAKKKPMADWRPLADGRCRSSWQVLAFLAFAHQLFSKTGSGV